MVQHSDKVREFARGVNNLATVLAEMGLIERVQVPVTDAQLDIAKELTRGLLRMGMAMLDGDMEKFSQYQRETVERGEAYIREMAAAAATQAPTDGPAQE
jgi:hypothetical protein